MKLYIKINTASTVSKEVLILTLLEKDRHPDGCLPYIFILLPFSRDVLYYRFM